MFGFFFLSTGYLSCCRFTDDNQILTSSGDMTWYVMVNVTVEPFLIATRLIRPSHYNGHFILAQTKAWPFA